MIGRYVLPTGRLARLEFWRGTALVLIGMELGLPICLFGFGLAAGFSAADPPFEAIGSIFFLLVGLSAWAIAVLSAQRLHDRDESGWWALVLLVPVVGFAWALAWNGTRQGTRGANRFGADPRGGTFTDAFDAGTEPRPRRRPPVASTVLAWLLLATATSVLIALLFYQPTNHPSRHPGRQADRPACSPTVV